MMTLGKNLKVSIDGNIIAYAKSCHLQLSQNFLEVCSPEEGLTMEYVPTTYEWGISTDHLISSGQPVNRMIDLLTRGTKCLLAFSDGNGVNRAGFAFIKTCDYTGSVGSLAKFSASFQHSGPLYLCKILETTRFHEGDDMYIKWDGTDVEYVTSSYSQLSGCDFYGQTGKLCIFARETWAIYNCSFLEYKDYLSNGYYSALNGLLITAGEFVDTVNIFTHHPTTFVCNDHYPLILLHK